MSTVHRKLTGIARYSSKVVGVVERNKVITVPEAVAKHLDALYFVDALGNKVPYFSVAEEVVKKAARAAKGKAPTRGSRTRSVTPKTPEPVEEDDADSDADDDEEEAEDE